jgi:hypothetical protein
MRSALVPTCVALAALVCSSTSLAAAPQAPASPPASTTTTAPAEATTPPPPAPTAEEVQKVTSYFLRGAAGGPILLGLQLCAEVGKNAEGKLECTTELGAKAKKGDKLTAFVRFFAPKGGKYDDVRVRFLLDGEVRSTSDMTVTESWTGYGNYKTTTASKAGTWEAQVLRGDAVLASRKVTVE